MWEKTIIPFIRKNYLWLSRLSLSIVYFWFGTLKLLGYSPATPLVYSLQRQTLSFIPFNTFYVVFSIFEMLIGILFLFPRFTRFVFILFILHMGMAMMPLVVLPRAAWSAFFVPTLEGQYMIKNLVLIALACSILVNTKSKR